MQLGRSYATALITAPDDWKKGAYGVVQGMLKEHLTQTVVNVVGGGQEWALVELEADAVCKNGMSLRRPLHKTKRLVLD